MKRTVFSRTMSLLSAVVCLAALIGTNPTDAFAVAGDEQIYTAGVPPMVLLVMGRDHKLYYEAYNDASDLNEDGQLDIGYKPGIDYYGYFDSYKCYEYDSSQERFEPHSVTSNKKCTGTSEWSGDFLNYLSMTRMDCMRKVLYGGYRSTDTTTETVLQRAYIPQDAHSFGKEYFSIDYDGYDIREYTPLNLPVTGMRHLFASTTHELGTTNGPDLARPLLRVLPDSAHRIWEWVAKERPVVDNSMNRTTAGGGTFAGHPTSHADFQDKINQYAIDANRFTGGPTPPAVLLTIGGPAPTLSSAGNPFGNNYSPYSDGAADQTNYLTIVRADLFIHSVNDLIDNDGDGTVDEPGEMYHDGIDNDGDGTVDEAGEAVQYEIAVDGDDAIEVVIDGDPLSGGSGTVIGYYGPHGRCNCTTHSAVMNLAPGAHSVEFHHEEASGQDNYYLMWRKRTSPTTWGAWQIIPSAVRADGVDNDLDGTIDQGGVDLDGNGTLDVSDELTKSGLGKLDWRTYRYITPITPVSIAVDYVVKVVVAESSMPESNCKQYPNSGSPVYKPIGLLQRYGEDGRMKFGLLTGSYTKNTAGGVLRKQIGYITDEIDLQTGRYMDTSSTYRANGIIKTIDRMRIVGFEYDGYSYNQNCGWIATRPISTVDPGECRMWGNPLAEMMYEGLRYFAGKSSPLSTYDYTGTSNDDYSLGLPKVDTWTDPFSSSNYCAKPFMLVLSDVNPTYDSDQLPGSFFPIYGTTNYYTTSASDISGVDVEDLAGTISDGEPGAEGLRFIGQAGSVYAGNCFPKTVDSFGDIRGLCPEEPTKQGSYYSASLAWFGRSRDISAAQGDQNVLTYSVAMASPLPRINIPLGGGNITLVPFAKSVGGYGISATEGQFQPTNTIVDFFVEKITPSYGKFRINYEDVEQGADHDMDAIVEYTYEIVDETGTPYCDPTAADFDTCTPPDTATRVKITLNSVYAAGSIIQHMGYVISGTAPDASGNPTLGTYLEVRDLDTGAASDPDYYLDTPPGRRPGEVLAGGVPAWDDNMALPLQNSRIFTVGAAGTAATLLKDPLWYAAKWGGFEDIDGALTGDYLKPNQTTEWDADENGTPDTYFYVVNPLRLEQQLNQTFASILSRGVSHVAPVVSVDEANRTQSGNRVFMAFFKPMAEDYWQGNLKKYGIELVQRNDCPGRESTTAETYTDSNGNGRWDTGEPYIDTNHNGSYDTAMDQYEWTVVDKNGAIAVDCDGNFKANSTSYWSSDPDGGVVNRGGAGGRLLDEINAVNLASGPYYDFRNIYTYKSTLTTPALVRFTRDGNDTDSDDPIAPTDLGLGASDFLTRDKIINWMYGYTYAARDVGTVGTYEGSVDGAPLARREWIMSDLIHSEPTIIDYLNEDLETIHRFIVIGGNDGMLHVFVDDVDSSTTDDTTIGSVTYAPGDEIWAFIPEDMLPRLQEFSGTGHRYFVDGLCSLYRSRTYTDYDGNGTRSANEFLNQTLVFGERRGGRSYWALNVTRPDPSDWTVKWHISNATTGFEELGQTWSRPVFARILDDASASTPSYTEVVIFGGGYHSEEDNFPENFDDDNDNGRWDAAVGTTPAEAYTDSNSSGSYDLHNLDGMNEMGRGMYVVRLSDGEKIFSAAYGATDGSTMPAFTRQAMKWCVPADPTVVDFGKNVAGDDLAIYQSDIYGQIWKLAYDSARSSASKWQFYHVFSSNPGSNQVNNSGVFSVSPSLNTADRGRKSFYSPDVSYRGSAWTDYPVLFFGTGDREHPRYVINSAKNRFYSVADFNKYGDSVADIAIDERYLLNLTCDEMDLHADTNQNNQFNVDLNGNGSIEDSEIVDADDIAKRETLKNILLGVTNYGPDSGDSRGWFRILANQGNCTQDDFDHTGESVLSMPVLFFGNVYFTSYQPIFGDPCNPYGNAFAYSLGYSYGTAALDLNKANDTTRTLEDSYQVIGNTSIPSSVRVVIREGKAAGLISAGGSVAGAGEEGEDGSGHSTTIPGQPGGIQMIQWRTN